MKTDLISPMKRRSFLKAGATAALTLHFSLLPNMSLAAGAKLSKSLKKNPLLESWISIDDQGRVRIFTGKVELGQGIGTALVQIATDELDVDFHNVSLVGVDTEVSPDEGYTFGSLSVQHSGMALRQAAAEVRRLLLEWAAAKWNVTVEKLIVTEGQIFYGEQQVSYGSLVAERGVVSGKVSGKAQVKAPDKRKYSGEKVNRLDIPAKVFAEGAYIHDVRLPGMLHARMVRPPSYTAQLKSLNKKPVLALPGVKKIIQDGSFIAVIAEREEQAISAAEALALAAIWKAGNQLPDENSLKDFIRQHPDAESEMIKQRGQNIDYSAASTHKAQYFRPFQAHASMGPSLGLAQWQDGHLKVWSHSQGIYPLRREIAEVLSLKEEQITITHRDGAGCYGHNAADDAALEAALLAMKMPGMPIRLQWMRQEEFKWEPYGAAMVMEAEAALDENGRICNWDYGVWGFPHSSRPFGSGGSLLAVRYLEQKRGITKSRKIAQPTGGLDRNALPYYDFSRQSVSKNYIANSPLRTSSLRGLGAYANIFAIESFMDELAVHSGQDPVKFHLRHSKDPRAIAVIKKLSLMANWQGGSEKDPSTGRGFAFSRYKNLGGYLAVCVDVKVDSTTGEIQLKDIYAAVDCGEVINPDGVKNQVEGGLLQAASWTLYEEVSFDNTSVITEDWASYPILTYDNIPSIQVHLMDLPDEAPLGAGEVAQGPVSAAIANAVYRATGKRLRSLPLTPEKVLNGGVIFDIS